ncbi:hypothetical protein LXL04_002479 [Taraxacum kok-saghyz]
MGEDFVVLTVKRTDMDNGLVHSVCARIELPVILISATTRETDSGNQKLIGAALILITSHLGLLPVFHPFLYNFRFKYVDWSNSDFRLHPVSSPSLVFHIFSATRSLQHMLNYMTLYATDNVCNSGYQIRCMMNYWNTVESKEKISYVSHIRLDKKQIGSEIWLLICGYSVFVFLLKSIYGHSFFLPRFEDIIKARNIVPIFMLLNILFVYMFLYVVSFLSNLMVITVLFSLLIRDSCINSLVVFQLMFLNDVALLE